MIMRAWRLARVALEAETLRLSLRAKRTAIRIAVGYLAVAVLFCALCFAHLAAWFWPRDRLPPVETAGVFAAADLVLAAGLAWFALHSRPNAVERDALAVRRRALDEIGDSLNTSALLLRASELLWNAKAKS